MEEVEEIVQIHERDAENRAEGEDWNGLGQFGSDWAECARTRSSTNGGSMLLSGACLKAWSTTRSVVCCWVLWRGRVFRCSEGCS